MATRPSFRPRPIDSSKPLPIVRSSKDLRHEDDVVVSRALPTVGTGVEAAELEERHLQQALLASVFGEDASNKVDIPIPVFEKTTPLRRVNAKPFRLPPDHYILFDRSDADLEDSYVDYDADHVDEDFVRKYNLAHKKQIIPLSMDAFERTMDMLEKLQGRSQAEEEEDSESIFAAERAEHKKNGSANIANSKLSEAENLLPFSQVRQELVSMLPACSDSGRREIHAHWVRRRFVKGGAFHRLYVKPPKPDDPNPGVAFRPRGREDGGGVGRRMNTYDNYKRAVLLREEFESLRRVMETVVERERVKARHHAVSSLHTRVQCVANGGSRLATISHGIAVAEREGFSIGTGDSRVVVSCRGLATGLPPEVEAVVTRSAFGPEKVKAKKAKRNKTPGVSAGSRADGKTAATSAAIGNGTTGSGCAPAGGEANREGDAETRDNRVPSSAATQQQCVDSFGHDDHGKRFIKFMRYFAGGFMNYGVCPYDHRVFSAASERNTVTEPPHEPKAFLFPSAAVKFGSRILRQTGGKTRPEKFGGIPESQSQSSDRVGGSSRPSLGLNFGAGISKKKPRPIKVRARVGRGGRIVLDRVVLEKDRGVKAASYPASVEMGGVYTAGLPLERAEHVASEGVENGQLGNIRELGREDAVSPEDRHLMEPLKPMMTLAEGRVDSDGHVVYWPSRKAHPRQGRRPRTRSMVAGRNVLTDGSLAGVDAEDVDGDIQLQGSGGASNQLRWFATGDGAEDKLRRMPQYARRSPRLIQMLN